MRKLRPICAGLLVSFVIGQAARADDVPLNILFFGNSYTQGYMPEGPKKATFASVSEAVQKFAKAAGHPQPRVLASTMGGKPLEYHLATATTRPAPSIDDNGGRPWTHVVLQELSVRPADKASKPEVVASFFTSAQKLADLVRGNSPKAEVVLYETWANRGDTWLYPKTYANPSAMMADVARNNAKAAADMNAAAGSDGPRTRVAPAGTAWGLLKNDPSLYNADGTHGSTTGYRLSAMVIYRTIYDAKMSDIPYENVSSWIKVTPEEYAKLVDAADKVEIVASGKAQPIAAGGR